MVAVIYPHSKLFFFNEPSGGCKENNLAITETQHSSSYQTMIVVSDHVYLLFCQWLFSYYINLN